MKAILVIDMPNSCEDCELHGRDMDGVYCEVCSEKDYVKHYKLIPSWCPLKPMPMRSVWEGDFSDGWNACIEEIENDQRRSD